MLYFPATIEIAEYRCWYNDAGVQSLWLTYTRGRITSPLLNAWEEFLVEYQVDAEMTTFSIERKKRCFIRIGSWHKLHHPIIMPIELWRNKSGPPPKLQLLELKDSFAHAVGKMRIVDIGKFV